MELPALCSPGTAEREGEGEEEESLGVRAPWGAEQEPWPAKEVGARSWWGLGLATCVRASCATREKKKKNLTQSTPKGFPQWASWLGESGLAPGLLVLPRGWWRRGHGAVCAVLFLLLPAHPGGLLGPGAERGGTRTAHVWQHSLYLLSYPPPSQHQDSECEFAPTQDSLVLHGRKSASNWCHLLCSSPGVLGSNPKISTWAITVLDNCLFWCCSSKCQCCS